MSSSEEKKEKPAAEKKTEQQAPEQAKPAEAAAPATPESTEKPAETAPEDKGFTPKTTASVKPTQCAGCGKNLKKRLWHYRNGNYFCTNKCYKRKVEDDAKKAAAAAEKAKAEAEKAKQA